MKKILSIALVLVLTLSGCTNSVVNTSESPDIEDSSDTAEASDNSNLINELNGDESEAPNNQQLSEEDLEPVNSKVPRPEPQFRSLNDPELLDYYEQSIYSTVSEELGDEYKVENVSAVYISDEYLKELAYNSQKNIFFGYTLAELDSQFQGARYAFTLGDNGETIVIPFDDYDDTYEKVIKNVAIGTGVILVCVTVAAVSGGLGLPAVSMIFAASAKSAATFAASSGAISGVIAGTVTGIQTQDFDKALKAGALAGSDSFKWGAITGTVFGGGTELVMLKTAAKGGLTLDEAALIIKETDLPANFIKQIHSMDEYRELLAIAEQTGLSIQEMSTICMATGYPLELVKLFRNTQEGVIYFEQAGLYSETINGQAALIRSIDLTYESELGGKMVTNLERMRKGYAAIDPATGEAFQLHHIGQSIDSPLAILSHYEHIGGGNNAILHDVNIAEGQGVHSLLSDADWALQREEFWESVAEYFMNRI